MDLYMKTFQRIDRMNQDLRSPEFMFNYRKGYLLFRYYAEYS